MYIKLQKGDIIQEDDVVIRREDKHHPNYPSYYYEPVPPKWVGKKILIEQDYIMRKSLVD